MTDLTVAEVRAPFCPDCGRRMRVRQVRLGFDASSGEAIYETRARCPWWLGRALLAHPPARWDSDGWYFDGWYFDEF